MAKNPADFLLLLSTADEKCVWEKSEHFLKAFLTLYYRGFESRLGEKTENFFEKYFYPPLFHYPLEKKRLFERKKDAIIQIFFSLIYLDRKSSNDRKNLKIKKALSQKKLCDRAA